MITDADRELASNFVLALSDLDDVDVVIDAITESRERTQHGGLRNPPGGRPRKNHIKWYCYLDPKIAEQIDKDRGKLTRGEYLTLLAAGHAIDRSNT